MSIRPWHSYGSTWHGKGFVKRGNFHNRGGWRSRPYFRRSFRKRTEEDEEDDQPEIKDEVGADDDEETQPEPKQEDAPEEEEKKPSNENEGNGEKSSVDVADGDSDVVEIGRKEAVKKDKLTGTSKYEIDKLMLDEDWEVMDETDDEDEEGKKKKLASDMLSIEFAVPEIAEQLKEVKDPLIGLEYLVEVRNEEGTTYYSCVLCKRPGRIAALLRHLEYIEHKIKYLEKHLEDVAIAFPRGHPTTYKHNYLIAMEKLCKMLAESNPRPDKHLITSKAFYARKLMALIFRAEQLPHMTFKDKSWKKVFEDLELPLKCRERKYHKEYRSRSRDKDRRSRSRDRDRSQNRDHYRNRGDYYSSYGRRGQYHHEWVPYHQYKYQNYYHEWVPRGYMQQSQNYYHYGNRSWNDYRNEGYYGHEDQSGYRGYEKHYHERESRSSYRDDKETVDYHHSSSKDSGGIYATTIKKKVSHHEKQPASKRDEQKATSAADVKKLWDQLTKQDGQKKKSDGGSSKSFWDQWLDGHEEEEDDIEGQEVTVIDQASSTAGALKASSDLNSVAELLDKNLTQLMNNYDRQSGSAFSYKETAIVGGDKVALAQKIAKALTTMGMSKIPQETLVLILQQLGLLPGGRAAQISRAMDNLRKTIVKFESVSQHFPSW